MDAYGASCVYTPSTHYHQNRSRNELLDDEDCECCCLDKIRQFGAKLCCPLPDQKPRTKGLYTQVKEEEWPDPHHGVALEAMQRTKTIPKDTRTYTTRRPPEVPKKPPVATEVKVVITSSSYIPTTLPHL